MVTFGIVSGWALTHVANHNPAFFFFSVLPCTEKLTIKFFTERLIKFFHLLFSAPGNFPVQIIFLSRCSTCLTFITFNIKITFVLFSEQPKTSWFLVILSKWFNRTKASRNQTLIGCLGVKLRSKFEIESSKLYFYLVFFEKKQ